MVSNLILIKNEYKSGEKTGVGSDLVISFELLVLSCTLTDAE